MSEKDIGPLTKVDEKKGSQEITPSDDPKTQKTVSSAKSNQASTQMQLLGLAKQFALDGGLVAIEKQMPIEDRTLKRERSTLIRKQKNLETIVKKSLYYCSDNQVNNKADHDWFTIFTQLCEDIGHPVMQDLWAKILASELTKPGSFAIKTLKAFREMSINDAKLFAKACSLASADNKKKNLRIIIGSYQIPGLLNFFNKNREQHIPLGKFAFSYSDVLALADNHLLFEQETESSVLELNSPLNFLYNGLPFALKAKKKDCVLKFYKFTQIGSELSLLISDDPDNDYLNTMKSHLSHHFSFSNN